MNKDEIKKNILDILKSSEFLQRRKEIHEHYKNVKCEGRYRDALLEEFNKLHRKNGLFAYAEVRKPPLKGSKGVVDLVIADEASNYFQIEFKYHYAADMARLKRTIADKPKFDALCADVETKRQGGKEIKGDAQKIVADCQTCHFFILIVQDRTGHPPTGTLPGNIEACVIQQQRDLDSRHQNDADQIKEAWFKTTKDLVDIIAGKVGGRQLPSQARPVCEDRDNPLTSHIFMLDRTGVV